MGFANHLQIPEHPSRTPQSHLPYLLLKTSPQKKQSLAWRKKLWKHMPIATICLKPLVANLVVSTNLDNNMVVNMLKVTLN